MRKEIRICGKNSISLNLNTKPKIQKLINSYLPIDPTTAEAPGLRNVPVLFILLTLRRLDTPPSASTSTSAFLTLFRRPMVDVPPPRTFFRRGGRFGASESDVRSRLEVSP